MTLQCSSAEEAAIIAQEYSEAALIRPAEHWLVVINASTVRNAERLRKTFGKTLLDMFKQARFTTDVCEAVSVEACKEYIQQINCAGYAGIMSMGGDGTLHTIVDALSSRGDTKAGNLALVAFPGGTGNATSAEMGTADPVWSVFSLIKGYRKQCDALHCELTISKDGIDHKQEVFTNMNVTWGLTADVDLKADAYRFLGYYRYYLSAILRTIFMKSYTATVEYLTTDHPSEGNLDQSHGTSFKYSQLLAESATGELIPTKITRTGSFFNIMLPKVNHITFETILSRKVTDFTPSDQLCFFLAPHSEVHSRWRARKSILKCFFNPTCYEAWFDNPNCTEIIRARAVKVTFQSRPGNKTHPLVAISGEGFRNVRSIHVESLPAALTFIHSPYTGVEIQGFS